MFREALFLCMVAISALSTEPPCSAAETPAKVVEKETSAGAPNDKSVGIVWVKIPGGAFTMGSAEKVAPNAESDDGPPHRVTIKAFEIAKTLVTNKQYQACVDTGVCLPAHYLDGTCRLSLIARDFPDAFQGPDQPVACVDWEQARVFSQWVGGRLPTEAEWEYAARSGGRDWKFPWGDEEATCQRAVVAEDQFDFGCGRRATWPVCSKPKGNTKQGLCDMAGNISEWVEDGFFGDYRGAQVDGSAPKESASSGLHIVRGGSCSTPGWFARSTHRWMAGLSDNTYGFRPARSLP